MDPQAFHNTTSGRVVQAGQGKAAYWSFVPNPLPPDLAIDWQLIHLLAQAERMVGELAGLGRMLPNPGLFIRPFLRREALPLLHLSAFFERNRQAYYEGLLRVSQVALPTSTGRESVD